jgi:hypothetical protein
MIAESNLAQKQKKAALNEENGLFDIWLPGENEYGHWEELFTLAKTK